MCAKSRNNNHKRVTQYQIWLVVVVPCVKGKRQGSLINSLVINLVISSNSNAKCHPRSNLARVVGPCFLNMKVSIETWRSLLKWASRCKPECTYVKALVVIINWVSRKLSNDHRLFTGTFILDFHNQVKRLIPLSKRFSNYHETWRIIMSRTFTKENDYDTACKYERNPLYQCV